MNENNIKNHFEGKDNFSRNELYQFYQQKEPNLNKNTFAWRIYNLKKKGVIVEIARGKYSFVDKKIYSLKLNNYSEKIALKISKTFPEIFFSISESCWVNEFTSHQYPNNYTIVEVEKEFTESVFFNLKESFKNIFLKPTEIDYDRYISDSDSAVILIPFISRSPVKKIENKKYSIPTIEKLLVDIFSKTAPYFFLTESEVKTIFSNALRKYNINQTTLLAYAERRGKKNAIETFMLENHLLENFND